MRFGRGTVIAYGCTSTFWPKEIDKFDNMRLLENILRYMQSSCGVEESV